ncbi:GGDEF domain-containing protein [Novosphingobium sp. RD2P27]|uniref:diguanylate cyclase n=1 Tax=Novosphingobium kalidii TaxID=3230299 RepID=A0ABV2D4N6_9SPHN
MSAMFAYPDGSADVQTIDQGAFRDRWHIGGQLGFSSRVGIPVTGAWLRIEGLEHYDLLRVRFLPGEAAARQFELSALAIGAALALLAIAAAYNVGLAVFLRRQFFLWHGCWAASVLVWGIVWSQSGLVLFPAMAGTMSARLATILACLAVMFAAFSSAAALRSALPETARRSVVGLGLLVAALGIGASLPGAALQVYGILLAIATLLTLTAVAISIGTAWWRGHAEGRDMAISWAFPMIVLGTTQLVDLDTFLWGGGAQIAVLFASAFQTLCLSSLATARLSALRVERDTAVAASNALAELADRDPLTGLLNRRGFVTRCEQAFGDQKTIPFGLLLIDIDHFKRVNDRFGHETGDALLVSFGEKLRSLEQRYPCLAGRMGGEEFVLGVTGLSRHGLGLFAEVTREELHTCNHSTGAALPAVTVSIGVAEGVADGPFRKLYGKADRALYAAKHAGRNTVVFASGSIEVPDAQISFFELEE